MASESEGVLVGVDTSVGRVLGGGVVESLGLVAGRKYSSNRGILETST